MALFAYSAYRNERKETYSTDASAILNVPLSEFKQTRGCTTGATHRFTKDDIGKCFNVKILDPVEMGRCIFKGFGLNAIPESEFRKEIIKKAVVIHDHMLVFQKVRPKKIIFVVFSTRCDAIPV